MASADQQQSLQQIKNGEDPLREERSGTTGIFFFNCFGVSMLFECLDC